MKVCKKWFMARMLQLSTTKSKVGHVVYRLRIQKGAYTVHSCLEHQLLLSFTFIGISCVVFFKGCLASAWATRGVPLYAWRRRYGAGLMTFISPRTEGSRTRTCCTAHMFSFLPNLRQKFTPGITSTSVFFHVRLSVILPKLQPHL